MHRFQWILYGIISKYGTSPITPGGEQRSCRRPFVRSLLTTLRREIQVTDLVDIAIPANAQAAAETLGLKVSRSVTSGAQVRQIPRDEAEIAVECLRDWGISARILEDTPRSERPAEYDATPAR
jgi:hypothetical protein